MQPGQTTLLSNPNTVIVYADSITQKFKSKPIAAAGLLRFIGLVFNNNGALSMDCAQINDGAAEYVGGRPGRLAVVNRRFN